MKKITIKLPAYHAAQKEIVKNKKRFNVICCGRRFGKTKMGARLMIEKALEGKRVAWFAPRYKLLTEVWRETQKVTKKIIKSKHETDKRLELITGGVIEFWNLEDDSVARGRSYDRVVVDEAAYVRDLEPIWVGAIKPILFDTVGDAFFISTPKGLNFFKTLYDSKGEDWKAFHFTTYDNPYIDKSELDKSREEMPELYFRQEILAEFVAFEGQLLKPHFIKYKRPPLGLDVYMGVDLAISTKTTADYSAFVILGRDQEGYIYVIHAERMRGSFNDVLTKIKELAGRYNPRTIAIESVQFQAAVIQELNRTTTLNVKAVRPDKDKITRFQPLLSRFEQGLIFLNPDIDKDLINEFVNFPIGKHDDYIDALGYAFYALELKKEGVYIGYY